MLTPVPGAPGVRIGRATPINTWTDAVGHGAVIAIDPQTGQQKWKFEQYDVTDSGILTTATDLLFTGGREGYFHALDARTGDAALEGEPRRPDRERPDHLRDRRQAVRVGDLGQLTVHVRAAQLTACQPDAGCASSSHRSASATSVKTRTSSEVSSPRFAYARAIRDS